MEDAGFIPSVVTYEIIIRALSEKDRTTWQRSFFVKWLLEAYNSKTS